MKRIKEKLNRIVAWGLASLLLAGSIDFGATRIYADANTYTAREQDNGVDWLEEEANWIREDLEDITMPPIEVDNEDNDDKYEDNDEQYDEDDDDFEYIYLDDPSAENDEEEYEYEDDTEFEFDLENDFDLDFFPVFDPVPEIFIPFGGVKDEASLRNAINAIPVGGYGTIELTSDIALASALQIGNRKVVINGNGFEVFQQNPSVNNQDGFVLNASGSVLQLNDMKIRSNGLGFRQAIHISGQNTRLYLESVEINGHRLNGVNILGANATVTIEDSVIKENGSNGINIGADGIVLNLNRSRLANNETAGIDTTNAMLIQHSIINIQGGVITDNGTFGIRYRQSGTVTLDDVLLINQGSSAIQFHSGELVVQSSKISNNTAHGIQITNSGNVRSLNIDDTKISNNGDHGIENGGRSAIFELNVANSQISDNGDTGIRTFDAFITLKNVEITNNVAQGIYLRTSETTTLEVENSQITHNDRGIQINSNTALHMRDSVVSHNRLYGIQGRLAVAGIFLESVEVNENGRDGIDHTIGENGRIPIELTDVTLIGSGSRGISTQGADVVLQNVIISGSGDRGIYLRLSQDAVGSTLAMNESIIKENETGIQMNGNTSGTIRNSQIIDNVGHGVHLVQAPNGLVIQNTNISHNGGVGVNNNTTHPLFTLDITGSTLTDNGESGIANTAGMITITDTMIRGNVERGIYMRLADEMSALTVINSQLTQNGRGIQLNGNTRLTMLGGELSQNETEGLLVRQASFGADLDGVLVVDNGGRGIRSVMEAGNNGSINISNTHVTGNAVYGVQFAGTGELTVMNTILSENGRSGLEVGGTATAFVQSATISGNANGITVTRNGHTVMESGVTIENNHLRGVDVSHNGRFTMNGGVIRGHLLGGVALRHHNSVTAGQTTDFVMNGGIIEENGNSASNGGGLFVGAREANIHLNGGAIRDNTAQNGGGIFMQGVYVNTQGLLRLDGTQIYNNHANFGGGLFLREGRISTYQFVSGAVRDNTAVANGGGVMVSARNQDMALDTIFGLSISGQTIFFGNVASGVTAMLPELEVWYANQVQQTNWSRGINHVGEQFTIEHGGVNNFDIYFTPSDSEIFTETSDVFVVPNLNFGVVVPAYEMVTPMVANIINIGYVRVEGFNVNHPSTSVFEILNVVPSVILPQDTDNSDDDTIEMPRLEIRPKQGLNTGIYQETLRFYDGDGRFLDALTLTFEVSDVSAMEMPTFDPVEETDDDEIGEDDEDKDTGIGDDDGEEELEDGNDNDNENDNNKDDDDEKGDDLEVDKKEPDKGDDGGAKDSDEDDEPTNDEESEDNNRPEGETPTPPRPAPPVVVAPPMVVLPDPDDVRQTVYVTRTPSNYEAILEQLRAIRYINGFPDDTVRADESVTRAQMAQMFFNLVLNARYLTSIPDHGFSDVASDDWFADAVNFFANADILHGYPDGDFRPTEAITNAEFAVFATYFFDLLTSGERSDLGLTFDHWARVYIELTFSPEWFMFFGADYVFRPDDPITRAQAVTLINHYIGRLPDPSDPEIIRRFGLYVDIDDSHWAFFELLEASVMR